MKRTLPLITVLLLAADPNRLPQDEARGYAKLCVDQAMPRSASHAAEARRPGSRDWNGGSQAGGVAE